MKIFLLSCMLLFFTVVVNAEEHVYKSKEEFLLAMEKMDKEIEQGKLEIKAEKAKTEAVMQLGRTVDKLASSIQVKD